MAKILYKTEVYEIIGVCLEVYNTLGFGFQEVVYKDAMEDEFRDRNMSYIRADKFDVGYHGITLKHWSGTDFTQLP